MKEGDNIDINKRYKIICPHCGQEQYATLSILQIWGMADGGRGICVYCNKTMRLVFDYDNEVMTAKSDKQNK